MNQETQQTPGWKFILITMLTLVSFVRLYNKCSFSNRNRADHSYEQWNHAIMPPQEVNVQNIKKEYILSYPTYQTLSHAPKDSLAATKWVKVERDTLIRVDMTSKLKIPARWFVQKPIDDEVRFVFLTPKNIQLTFYTFSSENNLLTNLYALRSYHFKPEGKVDHDQDLKEVKYSFTHHHEKFNGSALGIKEKNLISIFTVESRGFTTKYLDKFLMKFLAFNIIED